MTTIDLEKIHLDKGAHDSPEEGMCFIEAVAFIRRAEDSSVPFNDAPVCVSPVLRAFGIAWNDGLPDDERQELKRYIPLLPGTAGSKEADEKRSWLAADWLVRTYTPAMLRLAGLDEQAARLESLAELNPETTPTIKPTLDAIRKDAAAAWDAARTAAGDAAWDAAWAAHERGEGYRGQYEAAHKAITPFMEEKFAPVREQLQASAHQLFRSMIEVAA